MTYIYVAELITLLLDYIMSRLPFEFEISFGGSSLSGGKDGSSVKFKGPFLGSDILDFGSSIDSKGEMNTDLGMKFGESRGEVKAKLKKTYSDKY